MTTSTLKSHMNAAHRNSMRDMPTLHCICKDLTGVSRPGKTARDKANGHVAYKKNRRVWDDKALVWVKV